MPQRAQTTKKLYVMPRSQSEPTRRRKSREEMIETLFDEACEAQQSKDWRTAAELYTTALTYSPCDCDILVNLGTVRHRQSDLLAAERCYGEALKINPDHVLARYNLGNALVALGKKRRGIAQYLKALAVDPTFAEAHEGLAIVYSDLKMRPEAAAQYRLYEKKSPEISEAERGEIQQKIKDLERSNLLIMPRRRKKRPS